MKKILGAVLVCLLFVGAANATVNEVTARNDYIGNASTTVFPYTFKIFNKTDIEVLVDNVIKIVDSDYAVSGLSASGGGSVTFVTAPTTNAKIALLRRQPQAQGSNYQPNEPFPASRIMGDFDKGVMLSQMQAEQLNRSLHVTKGTFPFNAEFNPVGHANQAICVNAGESGLSLGCAGGGSGGIGGSGLAGQFAIWVDADTLTGADSLTFKGPKPWIDIAAYGNNIQAAVDAAPSTGANIYIPGGACISISTEITITKSINFFGDGNGRLDAAGTSGSCVRLTNATQNGFVVNTNEPVTFRNFQIVSSVATGGSGIVIDAPAIVSGLSGSQNTKLENMTLNGLYIGLKVVSSLFLRIHNSVFWACQLECVEWKNTLHHDQSDGVITGSTFEGAASAFGILWNSGGGLRIVNNKFLALATAIALDPTWTDSEAPSTTTTDFIISNNSIENFTATGILVVRNTGSKLIGNVHITNNQMLGTAADTIGVNFGTASQNYVSNVIIAQNLFNNLGRGISLSGGSLITVSNNQFLNITTGDATGIQIGSLSAGTGAQLCQNTFLSVTNNVTGTSDPCNHPTSLGIGGDLLFNQSGFSIIWRAPTLAATYVNVMPAAPCLSGQLWKSDGGSPEQVWSCANDTGGGGGGGDVFGGGNGATSRIARWSDPTTITSDADFFKLTTSTYDNTASQTVFYANGQMSMTTVNPAMAVPNTAFLNTGDTPGSGATGMSLYTTWTSGATAGSVNAALVVQGITTSTTTDGAPGAITGQLLSKRSSAAGWDPYGILGVINNDTTVTTPAGTGLWGIVRGKGGSGSDGIRSTAETDANTHPARGLLISHHLATNAFLQGILIQGAVNDGVRVGSAGGVTPTKPFVFETSSVERWYVNNVGSMLIRPTGSNVTLTAETQTTLPATGANSSLIIHNITALAAGNAPLLGFGGTYTSGGGQWEWAAIGAPKDDAVSGSNTGSLTFYVRAQDGATWGAPKMSIKNGVQVGAPTGGYQGDGSLNVQSLFVNGVSVAASGLIGSGGPGQETFWTGTSALSGTNNKTWDNTLLTQVLLKSTLNNQPLTRQTITLNGDRTNKGHVSIPLMYGATPGEVSHIGGLFIDVANTSTVTAGGANDGVSSHGMIVRHNLNAGYSGFGIGSSVYMTSARDSAPAGAGDNDTYGFLSFVRDASSANNLHVVGMYSQVTVATTTTGEKAAIVAILSNHANTQANRYGIDIGNGDVVDSTTNFIAEAAINIRPLSADGAGNITVESWQNAIKYSTRFVVRGDGSIVNDMPAGSTNAAINLGINGGTLFFVNANGTAGFSGLTTTGAATGKKVVCVDTATGQLYASSTGIDCSN